MKKLLCLMLLLLTVLPAAAQQQTGDQRTHQLFVFKDFQDAKILQPFGRSTTAKANIFYKNSALCFMQDGKVMQAYTNNVLGVDFDSVQYKKVDDTRMGRVVASKGYNFLLCVTAINMKKYKAETEGGDNLPFFEIPDAGAFFEIDGESFEYDKGYPLENKYFFSIQGQVIPANETQFKKFVRPEMKEAFKNLMNDRLWSWRDEASLRQLFQYLPD